MQEKRHLASLALAFKKSLASASRRRAARRSASHPVYQCMKESTGRIAAVRRRGTTRVKDRTRSPLRRVRSGTLGHDSTDVTAATATVSQSACRAMTHPAAGASCKLSRAVQPAVSRQPWYCCD